VNRLVDSGGLRAVVLADHDGLVVAGATSDPRIDLEVLAAVQSGRDVQVLRLCLGELRLSLVVQGTRRLSPEPVRAALTRLLA
jgi:predicted regulator of Ras-like GTPase activity (Roadblock/LC7/MglB family)